MNVHSLFDAKLSSRPKDTISVLKDVKTKEDTSSDSEDKMAAINKNLMSSKRKPDLLMDGGEVVEKRKKGRPRKDKMAAPMPQPFTQVKRRRGKDDGMKRIIYLGKFVIMKKFYRNWIVQKNLEGVRIPLLCSDGKSGRSLRIVHCKISVLVSWMVGVKLHSVDK